MASLGELTAGIAHEIQNPLNFVNNFSELSVELATNCWRNEKNEPDKQTKYIEESLVRSDPKPGKNQPPRQTRASIVSGMLQHARSSTGSKRTHRPQCPGRRIPAPRLPRPARQGPKTSTPKWSPISTLALAKWTSFRKTSGGCC
jgi:hypothetical protein